MGVDRYDSGLGGGEPTVEGLGEAVEEEEGEEDDEADEPQ